MKQKQISIIGIVFVYTIFSIYGVNFSFAECPEYFPGDCGDSWCCESYFTCDLISQAPPSLSPLIRDEYCIEKPENCLSVKLYGRHSAGTELLRSIRDDILSKTSEGRELTKLYYQWSPFIVRAMEVDKKFKQEVKGVVDGFLKMIEGDVE